MMSMRQELPTDKRYSLYLVPDEPVQSELQKLVRQLAGEFSSPVFVPHLTLLPEQWGQEAEILALVTSLAREVSTPITLQMLTVVARNSYFQCVLATTSLPEELAQLATGARQLFGVADENIPFHPHISLLYDGKDSTKTILKPEQKQEAVEIAVAHLNLPQSFQVSGIEIHTSTPVVSEWQQVAQVPFGK